MSWNSVLVEVLGQETLPRLGGNQLSAAQREQHRPGVVDRLDGDSRVVEADRRVAARRVLARRVAFSPVVASGVPGHTLTPKYRSSTRWLFSSSVEVPSQTISPWLMT